jgi:hypothetical protein
MSLRSKIIRLAYSRPELRKNLLPVLRKEAASVADIGNMIASVTKWKDELGVILANLDALIAAGEARRLGRVTGIEIQDMSFDGERVNAVVKGKTGTYQTRVTFLPKRGHRCTCPDWEQNGRYVGPCKHVLALGQAFKVGRVLPALDSLEDRLMGILEKTSL